MEHGIFQWALAGTSDFTKRIGGLVDEPDILPSGGVVGSLRFFSAGGEDILGIHRTGGYAGVMVKQPYMDSSTGQVKTRNKWYQRFGNRIPLLWETVFDRHRGFPFEWYQ